MPGSPPIIVGICIAGFPTVATCKWSNLFLFIASKPKNVQKISDSIPSILAPLARTKHAYTFSMVAFDRINIIFLTLAFDLGIAGYLTPSGSTSLPANQNLLKLSTSGRRPVSGGLTLMLDEAGIIKNRWYVRTGIGLNWTSYYFDNNVDISTGGDTTEFTLDTIRNFRVNRLILTHLQVPLLMGIRLGDLDNPFGLQVGVVGSYKIGSAIERKYEFNSAKIKSKIRDDYNLKPFKFEAIAKVSFGNFGVHARYSLTELFVSGEAPELYPFSVGISIGGF